MLDLTTLPFLMKLGSIFLAEAVSNCLNRSLCSFFVTGSGRDGTTTASYFFVCCNWDDFLDDLTFGCCGYRFDLVGVVGAGNADLWTCTTKFW